MKENNFLVFIFFIIIGFIGIFLYEPSDIQLWVFLFFIII